MPMLLALALFAFSHSVCARPVDIQSRHAVKIIQAALNSAGYNCGTADGIAGNNTRNAIINFQNARGMTADGIISEQLAEALGLSEAGLKGTYTDDFIERYNTAVGYLNDNSSRTGDPKIQYIFSGIFKGSQAVLDNSTKIRFALEGNAVSISGLSLMRESNVYDVPMVYELVAAVYAMDESFSNVEEAITFVGDYVENHEASTDVMDYDIWNHDNVIYFTIMVCD